MPARTEFAGRRREAIQVQDGSPAQAAGLQTGYVITTIGGIAITDTRAILDRGRGEIGETRSIVVDRGGQTASMNLEYAGLPSAQALAGHLGSLIGLSFLLFSLWAYRKTPNATTSALAWFGICFGLIFVAAPYFTSPTVTTVVGVITTVAVITGIALLLDFVMRTGTDEAYTDEKSTPKWIYWPAAGLAALLVALTVLQPATSSGMNLALRLITGVFFVGYFGGSLVLMARNYSGADSATRESRKLGMMLAGTIVGLGPLTVVFVTQLVSPSTVIPTSQYWFLALAAIPVTFALAAVHASTEAMADQVADDEAVGSVDGGSEGS